MLEDANIDKLVVLIDDLDRCLPDVAINTLEAVRLLIRGFLIIRAQDSFYIIDRETFDIPRLSDSEGKWSEIPEILVDIKAMIEEQEIIEKERWYDINKIWK